MKEKSEKGGGWGGAIKLYFTFENCIIKYLFVFYRTRNRVQTPPKLSGK